MLFVSLPLQCSELPAARLARVGAVSVGIGFVFETVGDGSSPVQGRSANKGS